MFNFSPFQNSKFRLPSLRRTAFFFDFDGMLIPLESDEHLGGKGFKEHCLLLRQLKALCSDALAIISRFPVNHVERFLQGIAYAVVGENGDAIRFHPGGGIEKANVPQIPPYLMSHIRKSIAHMHGVFLEHIEGGIMLRYIASPEHAEELHKLAQEWVDETKGKFRLDAGDMAWIISPVGIDKGYGISRVMENAPFKGRIPVFVGRNGNNEDAIETTSQFDGVNLRVPTDFPTAATFWSWLDSVVETHTQK